MRDLHNCFCRSIYRAEVRRSSYYHDCSGRIPGHTTRAPQVGFELETNSFQFYAIANLDKTSLIFQVDYIDFMNHLLYKGLDLDWLV